MKIGEYEINVPFVTTAADTAKHIVEFADLEPEQQVTDLGSGDGRVVLEFAKKGFRVMGYEINETLVKRSRERIIDANVENLASVYQKSFWDADLSRFDLIYIYGMQSIMGRLEEKLEKELKSGTKVILNIFHLPHWKEKKTNGILTLYVKQS